MRVRGWGGGEQSTKKRPIEKRGGKKNQVCDPHALSVWEWTVRGMSAWKATKKFRKGCKNLKGGETGVFNTD